MESTPKIPKVRIFIDSSVLFAAAVSKRGSARDLVLLGSREQVELAWSPYVLEETRRNLKAKAPQAVGTLSEFEEAGLVLECNPTPDLVREVAKVVELKDAAIVAGALAANATYLASYDRKHLLTQAEQIHEAFQIHVDTPDNILLVLTDVE